MAGRQELEALLGARGWGTTLPAFGDAAAPRGRAPSDEALRRLWAEGPPPGAIAELVPAAPQAAGLTGAAMRLAARHTRRGGRVAWLDARDQWDPDSAQRAGVALEQVLWLRGHPALGGLAGLSRWHQILGVVVQSGGLELVVVDFLAWPLAELRRTPRSAWFRLLRGLERLRQTALLLLAPEPLTQSCAALVVAMGAPSPGARIEPRLLRQRVVGLRA
ncbi:MAG TPA: hypothetical protein VMV31_07890 [Terriglobales bacterium]|nr:hypothetical protein [Terriglobales bacterium]